MMTEFSRETEDNMMGSTSPDFSNFQEQEVVDEVEKRVLENNHWTDQIFLK